jgi:hypothetical protein
MSEPQGKHICCWERENPHRCILCCQCGKRCDKVPDLAETFERLIGRAIIESRRP